MTNEQREAIEMLKYIKETNTLIGFNIADRDKIADTVLSLIKKQQEEIDKLKVNLAKSCADRTLDRETLKNQENENLEALHRAYNEELQKKDKQIDLMAKFIENNMSEKKIINEICIKSKCNNEECHEDDLKDCIKQYFERKVEDVKD